MIQRKYSKHLHTPQPLNLVSLLRPQSQPDTYVHHEGKCPLMDALCAKKTTQCINSHRIAQSGWVHNGWFFASIIMEGLDKDTYSNVHFILKVAATHTHCNLVLHMSCRFASTFHFEPSQHKCFSRSNHFKLRLYALKGINMGWKMAMQTVCSWSRFLKFNKGLARSTLINQRILHYPVVRPAN